MSNEQSQTNRHLHTPHYLIGIPAKDTGSKILEFNPLVYTMIAKGIRADNLPKIFGDFFCEYYYNRAERLRQAPMLLYPFEWALGWVPAVFTTVGHETQQNLNRVRNALGDEGAEIEDTKPILKHLITAIPVPDLILSGVMGAVLSFTGYVGDKTADALEVLAEQNHKAGRTENPEDMNLGRSLGSALISWVRTPYDLIKFPFMLGRSVLGDVRQQFSRVSNQESIRAWQEWQQRFAGNNTN